MGYHVSENIINTDRVNSTNWTTLKVPFYVNNNSNSDWINFDLWCFSRNDLTEFKSENNYVLIDDIKFHKVASEMVFGDNLFKEGEIVNFKTSQGRVDRGYLDLDGYNYSRELISKDFLKQFNENTTLHSTFSASNYLGTVELDIPPVFGDEGNYHYLLLTYDGRSVVKKYSSVTYLLHMFDFTINNRYTLEFDYKFNKDDTDIIRFAFVSVDNEDDFMIDLTTAQLGENKTAGVNKNIYSYSISDNGDGWYHVRLTFQPDIDFKSRVNSMRFLLSADFNENNKLYIANYNLVEYSTEELRDLPNVYLTPAEVEPNLIPNIPIYLIIGASAIVIALVLGVTIIIIKRRD